MPTDISSLKESLARIGQKAISAPPLIILGSGASMAHGVGGMSDLGDHLERHVSPTAGHEIAIWGEFKIELAATRNLELSLQRVTVGDRLLREIVKATHFLIARDDRTVLNRVVKREITLELTRLFKHLFQSTHKHVDVVTTNYDRLAEYGANLAGYGFYAGFTSGIYGLFDEGGTARPAGRSVNIWKVHGSIDWFADLQSQPVSLPDVPLGSDFFPLIVTPGTSKYQQALAEPFRTILNHADEAMRSAAAILCVGFGFRDQHIEPKLVRRLRQQRVPIVVLARTLTDETRKFLSENAKTDYLAMEHCVAGTTAFTAEFPNGVELPGTDWWTLGGFLKLVLGDDN